MLLQISLFLEAGKVHLGVGVADVSGFIGG